MNVSRLVGHAPLGITPLTELYTDTPIGWVHSSDLDDPSPFLEAGQMLLTTGRQFGSFTSAEDYERYVGRLQNVGVVALGFGTEVVRSGTPAELHRACTDAHLTLVQVPYATPFIAVSKFVADGIAAAAREQLEWALSTQDSISKAVLGSGGLVAAVRASALAIGCDLAILDPDGRIVHGSVSGGVDAHALRLLTRGVRARDRGEGPAGFWAAHTLGASGRLLGALVVTRPAPLSEPECSVLTMLSALTELSLEHAADERLGFRSVAQRLFELLVDGRTEVVRGALAPHRVRLPEEPFDVVVLPLRGLPPQVRDSIERLAVRGERLFTLEYRSDLVVLVDRRHTEMVTTRLRQARLGAGLAGAERWTQLSDALGQAAVASAEASPESILTFTELTSKSILGLLAESRVSEIARLSLASTLRSPEGDDLLREAAVWLHHNGAWEPAARALTLHRHTLKQHMAALSELSGLDLETFHGRAVLWALLGSTGNTALTDKKETE
ncbi:PucR family transcriptional regulator [Subtercola boreus]|nr:PucR family transcriptional regulator [Subtercola boreus]